MEMELLNNGQMTYIRGKDSDGSFYCCSPVWKKVRRPKKRSTAAALEEYYNQLRSDSETESSVSSSIGLCSNEDVDEKTQQQLGPGGDGFCYSDPPDFHKTSSFQRTEHGLSSRSRLTERDSNTHEKWSDDLYSPRKSKGASAFSDRHSISQLTETERDHSPIGDDRVEPSTDDDSDQASYRNLSQGSMLIVDDDDSELEELVEGGAPSEEDESEELVSSPPPLPPRTYKQKRLAALQGSIVHSKKRRHSLSPPVGSASQSYVNVDKLPKKSLAHSRCSESVPEDEADFEEPVLAGPSRRLTSPTSSPHMLSVSSSPRKFPSPLSTISKSSKSPRKNLSLSKEYSYNEVDGEVAGPSSYRNHTEHPLRRTVLDNTLGNKTGPIHVFEKTTSDTPPTQTVDSAKKVPWKIRNKKRLEREKERKEALAKLRKPQIVVPDDEKESGLRRSKRTRIIRQLVDPDYRLRDEPTTYRIIYKPVDEGGGIDHIEEDRVQAPRVQRTAPDVQREKVKRQKKKKKKVPSIPLDLSRHREPQEVLLPTDEEGEGEEDSPDWVVETALPKRKIGNYSITVRKLENGEVCGELELEGFKVKPESKVNGCLTMFVTYGVLSVKVQNTAAIVKRSGDWIKVSRKTYRMENLRNDKAVIMFYHHED